MTLGEVYEALEARLRRGYLWRAFLVVQLAYLIYPLATWSSQDPKPNLLAYILITAGSGLPFYFFFIWLSPVVWQWDGQTGSTPALGFRRLALGFVFSEILILLTVVFQDVLVRSLKVEGQLQSLSPTYYLFSLCFQGPGLFLVGNLLATRERMEQEREEMRQHTDAVMAEHLKGQVHPHVLFNTLNGLAELMQQDGGAAEALVEALSGFLHRVLDASQRSAWPLSEERRLADDFLLLEAPRLGERLRVVCEWDEGLMHHMVLPLMLQPLVENALKHGINPSEEGGEVRIAARRDGEELVLEVRNTCEPAQLPAKRTGGVALPGPRGRRGLGLPNLRRRLELAYGDQARFELASEEEGWTTARIRVNLSAVPRL